MSICRNYLFIGLIFFGISDTISAQAQNKIELLGAKTLKFDKKLGLDAQRLIGDVRFSHKGALMFCDSAYLYNSSNSLDAFGSVRILQGDTLTMTSDKLYYNGNTQFVKVRDNVLLKDRSMSLKTNTLDYDRKIQTAIFYDRGTITSTENQNKLVACEGIYDSKIEFFYFRDSVVLNNPKYRVETDTLNYSNHSEIAYFIGPTFIFSDENTIYCENGWYDTKRDISQFNENAFLNTGKEILRGDSLWYSRQMGLGKAYNNVSLEDTTNKINITGDFGTYMELVSRSLVTGHAQMIQYEEKDSLFMHGDTLLAISDSLYGDKVYAYPSVKFYKKDLQGAADSVVYSKADSIINMYKLPVLWSEDLQITGDTIQLQMKNNQLKHMYVFDHSFMINKLDSSKYNQIKGKRLTGYFQNNELYKVLIQGNGESLYYASEAQKKNGSTENVSATSINVDSVMSASADTVNSALAEVSTTDSLQQHITPNEPESNNKSQNSNKKSEYTTAISYIGVNKAVCSNIAIYLQDNQVRRIMFLTKPDGAFYPVSQFPEDERFFDGFKWESFRRPKNKKDIFRIDPIIFPPGIQQVIFSTLPNLAPIVFQKSVS